jgi:putative transposase
VRSIFPSRAALELENLALRHPIAVLRRSAAERLKWTSADRLLWICLSAFACSGPGRCDTANRDDLSFRARSESLIRKMCRENPTWGAPRIHGELLKLGIDIGESSASQYIVRPRKTPVSNLAHIPGESHEATGFD